MTTNATSPETMALIAPHSPVDLSNIAMNSYQANLEEQGFRVARLGHILAQDSSFVPESYGRSVQALEAASGLVVACALKGEDIELDANALAHMNMAAEVEIPIFMPVELHLVTPPAFRNQQAEIITVGRNLQGLRERVGAV